MKKTLQNSEADRRKLPECDDKIDETNLKVQLLADDCEKTAWLQTRVTSRELGVTAMSVTASRSVQALNAMTRNHTVLRLELRSQHRAGKCRKESIRAFVERACTGHSGLMRTDVPSYRNRLHDVLVDA